jgi:hypothetical protein
MEKVVKKGGIMKSIKNSKKLKLNKKTIARLNASEMNAAQGGDALTPNTKCHTTSCLICCE